MIYELPYFNMFYADLISSFSKQIDVLRGAKVDAYTLDMSAVIAGNLYEEGCKMLPATLIPMIQGRQRQLKTTIDLMQTEYQKLHTRYLSEVIFQKFDICFDIILYFIFMIDSILFEE